MRFLQGKEADFLRGIEVQDGDPYGERCYTYARDWADLMEKELAAGKSIPQCAEETSRVADTDGITGFMYGIAVEIISQCWVHGEDLRRWHNAELGEPEAKGTINPALIRVAVPDGQEPEEATKQAVRDAGMTPMDDLPQQ